MSKTKWYFRCHCERSVAILIALALVLSLGIVAAPMAGTLEAVVLPQTIEVSQPTQITGDLYEPSPRVFKDGSNNYWLVYSAAENEGGSNVRSESYDADADDYVVYYKTASTIDGLAAGTPAELTPTDSQ
jgi:hypothetical protein